MDVLVKCCVLTLFFASSFLLSYKHYNLYARVHAAHILANWLYVKVRKQALSSLIAQLLFPLLTICLSRCVYIITIHEHLSYSEVFLAIDRSLNRRFSIFIWPATLGTTLLLQGWWSRRGACIFLTISTWLKHKSLWLVYTCTIYVIKIL